MPADMPKLGGCVKAILKQRNQMVVLEPVPAQVYSRFKVVSGKAFDNSGIDTGIHLGRACELVNGNVAA